MTTLLSQSETKLRRCAICKIDLKGRFVYIDDKIESILGLTKEELFGKSINEFLDDSSQLIINNLLTQRNKYEIFYDATELNIINCQGENLNAKAIISLNFIAGNPVNYQLIIDTCEEQSFITSPKLDIETEISFLEELILLNSFSEHKRFLNLLMNFSKAPLICLYEIKDDQLEPVCGVSEAAPDDFIFDSISKPLQFHFDIARDKEEYSPVDDKLVQKAVEKYGLAVDEYLTCLEINDESEYLLRVVFDKTNEIDIAHCVQNLRLAVGLIMRIFNSGTGNDNSVDCSFDIRFTIGFLESLSIPAFLINKDGNLIGYNPSMLEYFGKTYLDGTYVKLFDQTAKYNNEDIIPKIIDYVTSSYENQEDEVFQIPINLSKVITKKLSILKISDKTMDLSSCFVFLPTSSQSSSAANDYNKYKQWHPLFRYIKNSLNNSTAIAEKIALTVNHNIPDKDTDLIAEYNAHNTRLNKTMSRVEYVFSLAATEKLTELIDLNLTVNSILNDLKNKYPTIEITCEIKRLPQLNSKKILLINIISEILTNAVKFSSKKNIKINIEAQIDNNSFHLDISDNGPGIPLKYQSDITDLNRTVFTSKEQHNRGYGLALVKIMIESLDGEIKINSKQGHGTTVSLRIPMMGI